MAQQLQLQSQPSSGLLQGKTRAFQASRRPIRCDALPKQSHNIGSIAQKALVAVASTAVVLGCNPTGALAAADVAPSPLTVETRVYDGARIISQEKEEYLTQQITDLERNTGWRVRIVTAYGQDGRPSDDELRAAYKPDKRSVVLLYDPSNPNLINALFLGDEVLFKLRRAWWSELQGRYGNLFYIREEGEQAAILSSVNAITTCLGLPEGCKVVPGVSEDALTASLALSVAGGVVAGAVTRIQPQGFVTARWQWLIVFSPLWASLFVNFGLGPIVSRTDDKTPLIQNTAAFLVAAASPYLIEAVLRAPPPASGQDGSSGQ